MLKSWLRGILVLILVALVFSPACSVSKSTWRLGTTTEGSFGYAVGVGLARVANKYVDDVHLKATPTPGSTVSNRWLDAGDVDSCYSTAFTLLQVYNNEGVFAGAPVSWKAYQTIYTHTAEWFVITRSNREEINSLRDLAGKKVFPCQKGTIGYDLYEIIFNRLGISIDKKDMVFADVADALKTGGIDAAVAYSVSKKTLPSWLKELDERVDIKAVNPTEDEKAAIGVIPGAVEATVPLTVWSRNKVESIWAPSTACGFHFSPDTNPDIVYQIVKAWFEHSDELLEIHSGFQLFHDNGKKVNQDTIGSASLTVPVHPGAARYYKEIGIWKDSWTLGEFQERP